MTNAVPGAPLSGLSVSRTRLRKRLVRLKLVIVCVDDRRRGSSDG